MEGINIDNIANIIRSGLFINIGIPLLAATGGILLKLISRKDIDFHFKRDDFFIGFDMTLGAMSVFFTKMILICNEFFKATGDLQKKLGSYIFAMPFMLLIWFVFLIMVSMIIRKWGWQEKKVSSGDEVFIMQEPKTVLGILLPLSIGVLTLIFAVNWYGGEK